MKYPNKDYIEHLRRKYPPGTRLQLSCMEDEFPVPPGSFSSLQQYREVRIGGVPLRTMRFHMVTGLPSRS